MSSHPIPSRQRPHVFFAMALLAIFTASCVSPVDAGLGAGFLERVAKDVIGNAEYSARSVVGEAERAGSALMSKGANELEVAARNIAGVLGNEAEKRVRDLADENRKLLEGLEKMRQAVDKLTPNAYKLKDSLVLDLKDLTGDSWLAKKHDFWLQRIDGIAQVQNEAGREYRLAIQGIGFGLDSDDRKNKILQIASGQNLLTFRESRPAAYLTEIYFPNAALTFDSRVMTVLPLNLKVRVSSKKAIGWSHRDYEVPISLTLMPKFGGSVIVKYSYPVHEWVKTATASTYQWDKPNCHRGNTRDPKRGASGDKRIEDGKRFAGPTGYKCRGEGCPYDSHQQVQVMEGGKRLVISIECDGAAAIYDYWADIEELKPTRTESRQLSVDFMFGTFVTIEVPIGTDYWTVVGKTSTRQPINMVNKQSGPILEFKESQASGNVLRLIYFAKEPE